MLSLNIGSGMLRLSSCMLSIGLGPKCEQGKAGGLLSLHELSLSMPEPMLSLSMLILATHPEAALGSKMDQIRIEP